MEDTLPETSHHPEEVVIPRWVQVVVGIFLGVSTLLGLHGSVIIIFDPNEEIPVLAPLIGVVLLLGCLWGLVMSFRLISGRKVKGGLLSPRSMRFFAWFFLLLPIGGIFTGYFKTHTVFAVVQAAAYLSIFFGLRSLASHREQHSN